MTHTKGERSRENNFGLEQKDKQGGRWQWAQTASPEPPQSTSAAPQKLVQVYKRQALIFKMTPLGLSLPNFSRWHTKSKWQRTTKWNGHRTSILGECERDQPIQPWEWQKNFKQAEPVHCRSPFHCQLSPEETLGILQFNTFTQSTISGHLQLISRMANSTGKKNGKHVLLLNRPVPEMQNINFDSSSTTADHVSSTSRHQWPNL